MVGESALVRMATARTLQELRSSRVDDLPSLVHDAFLLLLSDPIIGVHQSAVEALERISLPAEYGNRINERLMTIFMAYVPEDRKHHEFLVTCIELLVNRIPGEAYFSNELAQIFVAALMKVDDTTLLRHGRSWMLKRLANVEGFPDLLLKLLRAEERNEHHEDQLLPLLRELPHDRLLSMRVGLLALCKQLPHDWVLAAACIEALSAANAWDAAAKIACYSHGALADSTLMRARKQYAQLTVLATEFEQHLAEGRHSGALECAGRWRHILAEVECSGGNE
jgi:hypothetical protein